MSQSSAYYIWDNSATTKAFPDGFKMIAGNDPSNPQNFPNANAECVGEAPCERQDGCSTENSFFPSSACEELEVSMSFPSCWDVSKGAPTIRTRRILDMLISQNYAPNYIKGCEYGQR